MCVIVLESSLIGMDVWGICLYILHIISVLLLIPNSSVKLTSESISQSDNIVYRTFDTVSESFLVVVLLTVPSYIILMNKEDRNVGKITLYLTTVFLK